MANFSVVVTFSVINVFFRMVILRPGTKMYNVTWLKKSRMSYENKNLLIEIGCEELPGWTGEHFIRKFKPLFLEQLAIKKLEAGDIRFFLHPEVDYIC